MATISIAPRRRRWPTYLVVAVILGALIFSALAGFVVEVLWFNEIQQGSVFWHTLWTKVWLGVVFGILFFALLYINLVIARRLRPPVTVIPNPLDPLERVRDVTEPYLRWLLPLGAAVLALIVGLSVSGNWQAFLLWRNSGGIQFGNPEPLFGRDPAFYIFDLPWLRFLQGWLFSSLIGVTLLVAIAHVLWGGIRPQAPAFADKVTPAARAHLSVLLGLVMLVKAWGYWLGRFDLLTSRRGVVEGASYTEVHAQLPALNFLAIVGDHLRDPVLPEHPAEAVEPAGRGGRAARDRVGAARHGLPRVHPAVQGQAERAAAGAALHRGQHHRDTPGVRSGGDRPAGAYRHRPGADHVGDPLRTAPPCRTSACGVRARCRRTSRPSSGCGSTTTSSTSTWTATRSGRTATRAC